jgi:hypothetical protein
VVAAAKRRMYDMTTHPCWLARAVLPANRRLTRANRLDLAGRRSIDVELVALGILHGDSVVVEPVFAQHRLRPRNWRAVQVLGSQ